MNFSESRFSFISCKFTIYCQRNLPRKEWPCLLITHCKMCISSLNSTYKINRNYIPFLWAILHSVIFLCFGNSAFEIKFSVSDEIDFYGKVLRVPSRDASVRRVSEEITSTKVSVELYGPTPNMLPRSSHGDAVTGQNLHPRLTHMSSLSAPDVNEVLNCF